MLHEIFAMIFGIVLRHALPEARDVCIITIHYDANVGELFA